MARVLLVEDDFLLRESLKLALTHAGHVVVPAQDGAVALTMLQTAEFDIVVTDILMPETDGLEMIMSIRKSNNNIKIIAISGGGRAKNLDMLEFAGSFGANMVLAKPFSPPQLVAAISRLLTPAN